MLTTDQIRTMLDAATDGPWEVLTSGDEYTLCVEHPRGEVIGTDWRGYGHLSEQYTHASEPDARLIAAAPDLAAEVVRLREGINAIVRRFEDGQRYRIQLDDRTTLDTLRALLGGCDWTGTPQHPDRRRADQ